MSSHNSARIVACDVEHCKAPAGSHCIDKQGRELTASHPSRVAAAKAAPPPVSQAMVDALRKLAKRSDAYVQRPVREALVVRGLVTRQPGAIVDCYPLTAAGRKVAGIEET